MKRVLTIQIIFLSFCFVFQVQLVAQHLVDSLNKAKIDSLSQFQLKINREIDSLQKLLPSSPLTVSHKPFNWHFYIDTQLSKGNVNRSLIVTRAELVFTDQLLEWAMHPRFAYGEQNQVLAERDFFTDLNVSVFHKRFVYGFGMGLLELSNLRSIDLRWLGGAGIGFRIFQKESATFSISSAVIYEETNFNHSTENPTLTTFRNSTRMKGKFLLFHKKLIFKQLVLIQPSLRDTQNIRWNALIHLEFPIHPFVRFITSIENSYESIVAEGRKRNDFSWRVGLAIGK